MAESLTYPNWFGKPYATDKIVRRPFPVNLPVTMRAADETDPNAEPKSQKDLKDAVIGDKDVFIGISGFKALDLLAMAGKNSDTHYNHAILYDVNMREVGLMNHIINLIRKCATPEDFIREFTRPSRAGRLSYDDFIKPPSSPIDPDIMDYASLDAGDKLQFSAAPGGSYQTPNGKILEQWMEAWSKARDGSDDESWLKRENYLRIRGMVGQNRIATAILDLGDEARMHNLQGSLDSQGYRVGHCYLSSLLDFKGNANLCTDYFGRVKPSSSVEDARKFCNNLLGLGDDKTVFLASIPTKNAQIYHAYHVTHVNKDFIRNEYLERIPKVAPDFKDMDYCCYFNTGRQLWRLQSFDAMDAEGKLLLDENGKKQRYFRIIAENYAADPAYLEAQIARMNRKLKTLSNAVSMGKRVNFIAIPEEAKEGDASSVIAQASAAPHEVFLRSIEHEPSSLKYPIMASQPFTWGKDANDKTISHIVSQITSAVANTPVPAGSVHVKGGLPGSRQNDPSAGRGV